MAVPLDGLLVPGLATYVTYAGNWRVSNAFGFVVIISHTAVAEVPDAGVISTTGMAAPVAVDVDVCHEPSAAASLETKTADAEVGFATAKVEDTATLFKETKRRAPTGMLLNTALRRVPKSAKPAVAPFTGKVNPDSEL